MFLFSLFFSISLLFLINQKKEKQSCHESCNKEMYKYHYSSLIGDLSDIERVLREEVLSSISKTNITTNICLYKMKRFNSLLPSVI